MEIKQLQNVLTKIGFLVVMALVTAGTQVQGQSLASGIRASIPFDFNVADKKLPSGKYSIGRIRQDSADTVLVITNLDEGLNAIRFSIPVQTRRPQQQSTFVFHRYGDQYFLFQVWTAGESTGREFIKSRAEREIQQNLAANPSMKKMAKNAGAAETVTIVGALL